jgi:VWFA-related protein
MQVFARFPIVAVAILLSSGFHGGLNAQDVPRPAPASRRITVDVVVDAKGSKPPSTVGGLQQGDFTVLDNKLPRPITSFRALSTGQEPVRVVVLVDALNIRLDGLEYERNQISSFLRANGGKLAHPTTVAILTESGVQIGNEFSTDGNGLSDSLNKQGVAMRTLRRSTGIYGAEDRFGLSLNALRVLAENEGKLPGRTAVLWVSPGWPLLSGAGVDLDSKQQRQIFADIVGLSTQLREERVTLYAIDPIGATESLGHESFYESFLKGIKNASQTDVGDLSLQVLAIQSGGMALNSNDTGALLQRCSADLDNYYEISFEAAPGDARDEYRHIDVQIDKPRMIARTRDGYYAQP